MKQTFVDGEQLEENEVNDREETYNMKGGKDENKAMEKKLDQAFVNGEQGEETDVNNSREVEDVKGRGGDVKAQENDLKQESTNENKRNDMEKEGVGMKRKDDIEAQEKDEIDSKKYCQRHCTDPCIDSFSP